MYKVISVEFTRNCMGLLRISKKKLIMPQRVSCILSAESDYCYV